MHIGKNIVYPGSSISLVSGIYWGSHSLVPMDKGALLYIHRHGACISGPPTPLSGMIWKMLWSRSNSPPNASRRREGKGEGGAVKLPMSSILDVAGNSVLESTCKYSVSQL